MKIRNINDRFGGAIEFDSVEQMTAGIGNMGWVLEDGLKEGRDYEVLTMKKIKIVVAMGYVGCEHKEEYTFDDLGMDESDWDEMSEREREEFLEETAKEALYEHTEYHAEVIKEE